MHPKSEADAPFFHSDWMELEHGRPESIVVFEILEGRNLRAADRSGEGGWRFEASMLSRSPDRVLLRICCLSVALRGSNFFWAHSEKGRSLVWRPSRCIVADV